MDAFRQLAARLTATPADGSALDALRRELHRVRGTAGSFGYTAVSDAAAGLEARVLRWAADPALEAADRGRAVAALAAALERARTAEGAAAEPPLPNHARSVLLVGGDEAQVAALRDAASTRGVRVAALQPQQLTTAIVGDIAPHAVVAFAEAAARIDQAPAITGLPIIVVGPSPSDRPRLAAAAATLLESSATPAEILDCAAAEVLRREWTGTTIVVVDDDPVVLMLLRAVLDGPTQRVVTLADPGRVLHELHASAAAMLISDISMPQQSGTELVREVRRDPAFADLPILMLSGETEPARREEAHRAGADEIIPKPIAPVQLRQRVAAQLERHRLARLADERHAVTGLPLPARSLRDGEAAFEAVHAEREDAVLVMIRPDALPHTERDDARWLRESRRIAEALRRARFAGHHEGVGLLFVLTGDVARAAGELRDVAARRPTDFPTWRAGLVGVGDIAGGNFAALRRAAEEAADVALSEGAEVVHRWKPDEGRLAPDVVLVEDDPALSEMLQYALGATGFSFRAFANGRVALDHLLGMKTQGKRPFLLLDVDLPGMDGYSLHERLAAERPGAYAVVFITVHAGESDQLRALRGGAVDYLTKPLNLRILMAKMASWRATMGAG